MICPILALPLYLALAAAVYIVPGARWYDTTGALISAHGGNVLLDPASGRFFWFGEYKTAAQPEGGGVSVYSSADLATWTPHGLALAPVAGDPFISPDNIIQRPKVVAVSSTAEAGATFHMWWHADNASYGLLLQGLATADSIAGPYAFQSATAPLGNWSQDFGMFTDYKTGRSYALYANGDTLYGRDDYISVFNENVTAVEEVVYRFGKYDLEAPAIAQTEESYWMLMSHKTGYRPNDVVAFRADSLAGPWSQPFLVAPKDTRTYNSQSGFVLRIEGSKKTTLLYLGDQWDQNSIEESRYIWLPIAIDEKKRTLGLVWCDVFDLDVKTGEWASVEGTTYHAKDAVVSGGAFLQEANFASEGVIATGIYGNSSTITFTGVEGDGSPQWVSFYYQNTDDTGFGNQPGGTPDRIGGSFQLRRISSVVVNGNASNVETLYQHDTNKGVILSAPLLLSLNMGSNNSITVGGLFNGFDYKGADLDKIVVYPAETGRNLSSSAVSR